MRLDEVQDQQYIAAARIILTNVEYAVAPKRLLDAYNVLMSNSQLHYSGKLYRVLTIEDVWGTESTAELAKIAKRRIPQLLKPRAKGLVSFTKNESGLKALYDSLGSSGMVSSPFGIVATQTSVGLDVNKVCDTYVGGCRFANEQEVLAFPDSPMVLDMLFTDSMRATFDPSDFDAWVTAVQYEVGM